jgi:hypothetical protein
LQPHLQKNYRQVVKALRKLKRMDLFDKIRVR